MKLMVRRKKRERKTDGWRDFLNNSMDARLNWRCDVRDLLALPSQRRAKKGGGPANNSLRFCLFMIRLGWRLQGFSLTTGRDSLEK